MTEQKRREEALRLSEGRLRESQRIAHVGSWSLELDRNEAWWSEEVYRIFGIEPEGFEVTFESFLASVHPDDRTAVTEAVGRAVEEGGAYQVEHRIVRPDGTERIVHERGEVERDESGEAIRMLGTVQDVTHASQAAEAARKSSEQLRALSIHLEQVREQERIDVARELHDEVGQAMTALQMDLGWLRRQVPQTGAIKERLDGMVALTESAIDAGRRIATRLRPGVLDDLGLPAAVDWVAQDFAARSGLECEVQLSDLGDDLDARTSTAFFRILQEALTNVMRHAKCRSVTIRLDVTGNPLLLEVEDDGRGVRDEELDDPRSLGVLGMRERAAALGGTLEIEAGARGGTTVLGSIPEVSQGISEEKRR